MLSVPWVQGWDLFERKKTPPVKASFDLVCRLPRIISPTPNPRAPAQEAKPVDPELDRHFRYQFRWELPSRFDGTSLAAVAPPHHFTQLAITRWTSGWW